MLGALRKAAVLLLIALSQPVLSDICDISEAIQYGVQPSSGSKFTLAVHHISLFDSLRTNTFTLLGDVPFRGFLLYVVDRNGDPVGHFTSYDEAHFSTLTCSEETKGDKFISHRKLVEKYPPYNFEWNDDIIADTVTVKGMIVVSETEYYNIDPIPFHPVPKKLLIPRQLSTNFSSTENTTSAANATSTSSSATASASSAASSNSSSSDSSGDGSNSGSDPGFLGFGPGTPKGKRPIKDNLLFLIYIAFCVILYFVGNALETRLKVQDRELKARRARLNDSQKASKSSRAVSNNNFMEMETLEEVNEPYNSTPPIKSYE